MIQRFNSQKIEQQNEEVILFANECLLQSVELSCSNGGSRVLEHEWAAFRDQQAPDEGCSMVQTHGGKNWGRGIAALAPGRTKKSSVMKDGITKVWLLA
jgi:hypothetical protein